MSDKQLDLATVPESNLPATTDPTPLQLMQLAIEKYGPEGAAQAVGVMERLVELQERMEDRQAGKDFAGAMADFQMECPDIPKSKKVRIITGKGTQLAWDFAPIDKIMNTIRPVLHKHGLSVTWDSETAEQKIKGIATITHRSGHSKTASFGMPVDASGVMGTSHKHASALSFVIRRAVLLVLGIVTADDADSDNDMVDDEKISDEQALDLQALIDETKTDKARLLKWAKADSLADIRAVNYAGIIAHLNTKKRGS